MKQINKKSCYGFVIDWEFHRENRWVCALTPYLIDAIIREFDPVIISSQFVYEWHKRELKYIISVEPGWAAPKITYDTNQAHVIGVFASDPHNKKDWFQDYIYENDIQYVFSYYYHPFLYHFPDFDRERLIHMPWAVPDHILVDPDDVRCRGQRILHLFGAAIGQAYDTRNWCRGFAFTEVHQNSGVENKVLLDAEYFHWCRQLDAVVAAGSLDKTYQLVTPKYFEIAAGGSLLFAQYCEDLALLGFCHDNSVIFDRNDFVDKANEYLKCPEEYLEVRRRGCRLMRERHKVSDRIKTIKELMNEGSSG